MKNIFSNDYKILGDVTILYLDSVDGVKESLIDTEDLQVLKELNHKIRAQWDKYVKGYYAHTTLYKGVVDGGGFKYDNIKIHSVIMNCKRGEIVDHKNHNTLDNRKSNLRKVTKSQNCMHRSGKNSNNSTGYRNVSYSKSEGKYIVQLQINKKNTVLGKFDDVHEAGKFAKEMRKKHYGEYAGKG